MALVPETIYSVGRAARRLEAAALAVTLTNNPAPALEAAYNAEAAACGALIGGGGPVDGAPVAVENYSGSVVVGTHIADVVDGDLTVMLDANVAPAYAEGFVNVLNSAGFTVDGAHTCSVFEGNLDAINLDGVIAPVLNGSTKAVTVTGTYSTSATFTVVNGAITAIVLS